MRYQGYCTFFCGMDPGSRRGLSAWVRRALLETVRSPKAAPAPADLEPAHPRFVERFGPGGEAYGGERCSVKDGDSEDDEGPGVLEALAPAPPPPLATVRLFNLPYTYPASLLRAHVETVLRERGHGTECLGSLACMFGEDGRPAGWAECKLSSNDAAEAVVERTNGVDFWGRTVR